MNLLLFGNSSTLALPLFLMGGDSKYGGVATTPSYREVEGARLWDSSGGSFTSSIIADPAGADSNNQAAVASQFGANMKLAELAVARYGGCYIVDYWKEGTSSPPSCWANGWHFSPNSSPDGQYVDALLAEYDAAVAWLNSQGLPFFLAGFGTELGIVDAQTEANAHLAGWYATGLVNRVRKHTQCLNLRTAIATVYANGVGGYGYASEENASLTEAAAWMDNCTLIDISGFSHQASNIHFDAAGYDEMGEAFFDALVVSGQAASFGPQALAGAGALLEADAPAKLAASDGDITSLPDRSPLRHDGGVSGTAAHNPAFKIDANGRPYLDMVDSGVASTSTMMPLEARDGFFADTALGNLLTNGDNHPFYIVVVADIDATGTAHISGKLDSTGGKSFTLSMAEDNKPGGLVYFDTPGTNYRGNKASSAISTGRHVILMQYDGSIDTAAGGMADSTGLATDRIKVYVDDAATPLSVDVWVNNGSLGSLPAGSAHWSLGQHTGDGSTGNGNAMDGKLYAHMAGSGLLSDSERTNLMQYFTDKWLGSGFAFNPLMLPNLAVYLDPSDSSNLTRDGSDLVSAANNPGLAGNWSASGVNRPKYVEDAINGNAALRFFHDGSNYSVLQVADHSSLDYSAFELAFQFRRLTDTGVSDVLAGKGTSTGNQREFFTRIGSANDRNDVFVSTSGTAGTSSSNAGTTPLSLASSYIGHARFNGTTTTFAINDGTAQQASLTAAPFNGTGPFILGSLDGVLPFKGYIGKVIFCTCAWDSSVKDATLNWLAEDAGVSI